MPLPPGDPTSLNAVKAWAKITDDADDTVIDQCVAAVNALVRGLRVAERLNVDPPLAAWPGTIPQGATMLAARLWRRRNTPGGVEAIGDLGPVYVRRSDPDVAQLLELDDYATPGIG